MMDMFVAILHMVLIGLALYEAMWKNDYAKASFSLILALTIYVEYHVLQ